MRSYDRSPRIAFEAFAAAEYDLVWFSTAALFAWLGRPRLGPTIVDLMDLEDVKARQKSSLLWREQSRGGLKDTVVLRCLAAVNRVNAHDWKVFQRSVASQVDRVILCSDEDVRRSGIHNAVAVPNTYGRPERSLGRQEMAASPTILFQGSLHYGPNIDAVDWLIDDVAPYLWEQLPGAQIRLVGTTSPGVVDRHRPPVGRHRWQGSRHWARTRPSRYRRGPAAHRQWDATSKSLNPLLTASRWCRPRLEQTVSTSRMASISFWRIVRRSSHGPAGG